MLPPNPFGVDLDQRRRSYSLLELLLLPLVVLAAYELFQHLGYAAYYFFLGLVVIDGVICLFDAGVSQPAEQSYRASPWRLRLLSAMLISLAGLFFPAASLKYAAAAGAGIGYVIPALAKPVLTLIALMAGSS